MPEPVPSIRRWAPSLDTKGLRVAKPDTITAFTGPRPNRLFAAYLFDLDGTIYLGESLLPGANALIDRLHVLGRPVRFLSNNPTKSRAAYVERLNRLGIAVTADEIVTSVQTMVAWLQANHPDAVVFPISEAPLIEALDEAGIRRSENPSEIDIVIASYDRTFEYRKLQIAFDAIWYERRAFLISTNPDRFCPFPGGRGEPDAAGIVAAIEATTGTTCRLTTGKPSRLMLDMALEPLGVDAAQCVMVGDRLTTDIAMAIDAGLASALVLTGETNPAMLAEASPHARPTYVLDRIDHLLPADADA
jgi:phosphoglycolate/pyridoxal phosphate phosphatase family enzyme